VARKKVVNATHARTEVPSTRPPQYATAAGVTSCRGNELPYLRPRTLITWSSARQDRDGRLPLAVAERRRPERIRRSGHANACSSIARIALAWRRELEHTLGQRHQQFEASPTRRRSPISLRALGARHSCCASTRRSSRRLIDAPLYHNWRLVQLSSHQGCRASATFAFGRADANRSRSRRPAPSRIRSSSIAAPPDHDAAKDSGLRPRHDQFADVALLPTALQRRLIAYVEAHVSDVGEKNALCTPVPSPERPTDWLPCGTRASPTPRAGGKRRIARLALACRLNNLNAMTHA